MLSIKVAYNKESEKPIKEILAAVGNPMFEFYNEDDPKQIKKAWKYKSAAGARQLPFIGVYEKDSLIKAFYAEDNSATDDEFFKWLDAHFKETSKAGYIKIVKQEGNNNEYYQPGNTREGFTSNFTEGISLLIICPGNRWFRTSPIVSIDWEGKTFKTCNSIYSFEFDESRTPNNETVD